MPKDLSIEYAHIYTNNRIGDEHALSLDVLKKMTRRKDRKTYALVVMVDDYSFPDPTFKYRAFVRWLSERKFKPDFVLRESQLIPACDKTLKLIVDKKLKAQLVDYIKTKKYPCSLFIAAWYLLRLGHLSDAVFDKKLVAAKLANILPASFKPFEDKAKEILLATKFSDAVDRIDNKYFEGRLVA